MEGRSRCMHLPTPQGPGNDAGLVCFNIQAASPDVKWYNYVKGLKKLVMKDTKKMYVIVMYANAAF